VRGNATTSWRDKTTRGQRNERATRDNATTSWRDSNKMTRGRRNEGTSRGDATTSWHNEMTPGRCNERQHNLVLVRVQTAWLGSPTAKSRHIWPTGPRRADTNSFPTLFLCQGLPTFSKFSLSTRGTYGVIIVQTSM
jgi:hypothetical protein